MPERMLSYADAINEALIQGMTADSSVILIGEGVPDPKAIFGTTAGLRERFGAQRVFDMPLAENGVSGICIGAALAGMRPVLVHQRVDFSLLAMDAIVNQAAKWRFLFGDDASVPLVVRALIGRGWGQGPQHAQSLQALYAHVPGLRVLMPATASDAKGMMLAALRSSDPVIFLEHRWLHSTISDVSETPYVIPLDRARVVKTGSDLTIVAFSYMVIEALRAAEWLNTQGIAAEVLDMRIARPLDLEAVLTSLARTGRLLVLDTAWKTGSVSGEVIAQVAEYGFHLLKRPPTRIALPDLPAPTAPDLADHYYPEAERVAAEALQLVRPDLSAEDAATLVTSLRRAGPRDVPYAAFKGPF